MRATRVKYEQLIGDLRSELRPQREWGEGRGILLVIGHFVVGVGAGAWLFSLWYGSRAGLVVAFALAALGGLAHLGFLGRPERFWKMPAHWRTSWISRGFIGLAAFLAGALLYLAALYFPGPLWSEGSAPAAIGYLLALAGMIVLIGYMGFVYTASKAIPFWNSPLHPALYIVYALRGGIAALLVTLALGAQETRAPLSELLALWTMATALVVVFFALEVHGALTCGNIAARRSVHEMFAGRVAVYFYGGTLALGMLVPALLVWKDLSGPLPLGAMAVLGLASALGDFFMKYSTIRAGVYLPVWTRVVPQR